MVTEGPARGRFDQESELVDFLTAAWAAAT